LPPCVAPQLDDSALLKAQYYAPLAANDCENVTAQAPVAMAPHQATYSLEQVKELLALERQRLQ